jgi:alginate O-acetyltransferase complex protein AlgJ
MRRTRSRLIIMLALGLLWLPAVAYGWNAMAPWTWTWRSNDLIGVQLAGAAPSLTPEAFANGSLQDSLARTVGPSIPFYGDAVRLHNQILYAGFGISPSPHILIGKDGYLHNPAYANAYCSRDIAASAAEFRDWARKLRETQDLVERRGQIFLYVLTPSKVEHIPHTLPEGFPCPSPDRHSFVAAAVAHLDAAGVKHVDATARMDAIQTMYGYEPFPKSGIHWTDLAAYLATLEIMRAINTAKGDLAVLPYEITVERARVPALEDYDYASLLNVLWTPMPNDTAAIAPVRHGPARCPPPVSIAAVGGSFFTALGKNLSRAPCPSGITQLSYLTLGTLRFEAGALKRGTTPGYEFLRPADVVIVEENVGILLKARHVSAFHAYLHTGKLPEGGVY